MKTTLSKTKRTIKLFALLLFALSHFSCGQLVKTTNLIGDWETESVNITVRTKPEGVWTFTSDSCLISLKINEDFSVEGKIGQAEFMDGEIKTNWLLPVKMTGQAYTIKCGSIGKIFENDPLESKKVEIWVSPFEQDTFDFSLRLTEGGAQFPMAHSTFIRSMKPTLVNTNEK